ncbi:hypothetical protein PS922_02118 [Pseudomonas fluorescens]|uniref:Uncharacterized protein n=1 Tax=Pseudomonas fluorescens TaxID=294 RepID=A0A5E7SE33_PSEFL|nr:hypothetical protein PS922_02118 [Pseudomonas fluorescens]
MKAVSVPPPGVGGRYRMDDGRLYEVINVTRELVSFRDTQCSRSTQELDTFTKNHSSESSSST